LLIDLPSGRKAWLIGDPHLGRKFEVGVPLHRRGDRERRQMEKFKTELATPDVDYVIMVGDLFDHPHVGYSVVCEAAEAVLAAAKARPKIDFIMMAGNHDVPRNLSVVGAWNAFEHIVVGRCSNLIVLREPVHYLEFALFPWQWGVSAADQVAAALSRSYTQRLVAIGHWDLQSYGGDDSHIAPVAELAALGITEFYSGHYHTEGTYPVGDHLVRCTGSMEPYSHGEDPDGEIYVTLTLAELADTSAEDLKDKCVRVLLADGEELPTDVDCFALTAKRVKEVDDGDVLEQVSLADFDWNHVLAEALEPLEPEVKTFITERLTG
jgi:DNA repair exonuclease SbcCD nuclease subunit